MDGDTYSKEERSPTGALEKALVVQEVNDLDSIEQNPKLLGVLKEIDLTPDEFRKIVSGDYKDTRDPIDEELTLNGIMEKAHLRFAQIGDKLIEIAYCSREEDSKRFPSEFDFQFRQKGPAYKILVGLKGEGILRMPRVEPAGLSQIHMYAPTDPGQDIPFKKGTIAVIQAPTAWSFQSSRAGLEYLYISFPKYSSSIDTTAQNIGK